MSLKWTGDAVVRKVNDAGQKAAAQAAEMILAKSKQAVPVLTGALMRSGDIDSDKTGATIFYNTPYAVRQHETHATKSKYLETPFVANRDAALKLIARALGKEMGG